jgi:hypothetical protein
MDHLTATEHVAGDVGWPGLPVADALGPLLAAARSTFRRFR